jgi:hypothetical protein
MGYFADQSGIIRRYRRERQGWDVHLQHTKQYVIEAAQSKNKRSAIVLGSGWLLDVPLRELSQQFAQVSLADIRHPASVKKQVAKIGNVTMKTCDISGFALPVYLYTQQYRKQKNRPTLDAIQPNSGLLLSEYDFVFSCNILNQLDILLIDYLSQFFRLDAEEITAFRKRVQRAHIESLPLQRSCLVTDIAERIYAPNGAELALNPLVHHPIVYRKDAQRWIWPFDTCMTYYSGRKTSFEVMAVDI